MPEMMAVTSGKPKHQLVSETLSSIDAGLLALWEGNWSPFPSCSQSISDLTVANV